MSTLLAKYGTYEEELMGHIESIIAHAGGGQANATAVTKRWNQVDTCANDGDSVKLIAAKKGYKQVVFNNTSKQLAIYPVTSEKINAVANLEVIIGAGQTASFESPKDGEWTYYLTVNTTGLQTATTSLTLNQIKTIHTNPVQLIPAPGPGLGIVIVAATHKYTYNGQYTGATFYPQPIPILYTDTCDSNTQYQAQGPAFTVPLNNRTQPYTSVGTFTLYGLSLSNDNSPGNVVANKGIYVTANTQSAFNDAYGNSVFTIYYMLVNI